MDYTEFKEKYGIRLNEQQEAAVQSVDGPCLLLAVPGSGKTTVLVNRLGYMIYGKGIAPENILVLTYTVAATKDMSERFMRIFGEELRERLEFRTINGVCSKILMYYSRMIGRPGFDLESEEADRRKRITRIYLEETKEYPSDNDVQDVGRLITYIKNMMLDETEIKKLEKDVTFPLLNIYKKYLASMKEEQRIDYDDQMVYALKILNSSPETLAHFQNQYPYICIDEAQDTSKIQHVIVNLLAGKRDNLFMVGDEDQSIYQFRASFPQALLDFEKNHPGAKILLMETNFRSNAKIVRAADRLIKKNRMRYAKNLVPFRPEKENIQLIRIQERADQYKTVMKLCEETAGHELAVLYRDNESIIPIVDMFDRKGWHFRMKNAEISFFTHRITVDILTAFRFALNPRDVEAFMSLYYKFTLFMSKSEAMKLCEYAAEKDTDILTAGKTFHFVQTNPKFFQEFSLNMRTLVSRPPAAAMRYIMDIMGYKNFLKSKKISMQKTEVLMNLFSRCKTLEEAITRVEELQEIVRTASTKGAGKILFSTIHSSKGLEYENVVLLDTIDGVFPTSIPKPLLATKEEESTFEEERRIFYVGVTRAKDGLYLLYKPGCSVFIEDMLGPPEPAVKPLTRPLTAPKRDEKRIVAESMDDYCKRLKIGRKVVHKNFGSGVIRSLKIPFVSIEFTDKVKTFGIQVLIEKDLLKFPAE